MKMHGNAILSGNEFITSVLSNCISNNGNKIIRPKTSTASLLMIKTSLLTQIYRNATEQNTYHRFLVLEYRKIGVCSVSP